VRVRGALSLFGIAVALAGASACSRARPEGEAIVVALANSPVNLDPRVGSDEASENAHQLLSQPSPRLRRSAEASAKAEVAARPFGTLGVALSQVEGRERVGVGPREH
jgi:hypothetical protein